MAELINNETLAMILVAIFFILILYRWSSTSTTTNSSPPSPPKLPIIGNLHQIGSPRSPLHLSLQALSQVHGPLMLLHFGSVPVLVVSSAEAAQAIMKTHDLTFSSRPKSTVFAKLLYNSKDVATAPYGEYWRQVKSICVLNLLSNKRVRSFRGVREEETKAMMMKIRDSEGGVVNLRDMLLTLTNDVVSRVALGKSYYSDGVFKELSNEHTELLGSLYVGDYIPWLGWLDRVSGLDASLDRVAKLFDDFLDIVIQEHMDSTVQKAEDEKDFVDVLLELQQQHSPGFRIDRTSIKGVILDMFLAGTDTIATLAEWTMAEIIKHPKVMSKLQTEIRAVNKGEEDILTEDDVINMHYLNAVIKETLRLHPPLPLIMPRQSTQDVELNGYNIKANTQIIVNVWQIGRDRKSYYKPDEFEPERFLNPNSDISYKGNDFELIPFGAGRRMCPGIQFATTVNEIALANLLHKFDWTLPAAGGVRSEDLDMTETSGITVHKKHPLKAFAAPYSSA
ncbi:PREDICTED: cytochrome P450 71A25-like isoform X1 [Fragaria vesca subsp. vesca]|uniref:cytochrome P450 71A25-like isoform X1 n=1 Tax=Fragaria vesca subsp. vesca TaxID=101020 RepID=UPI0002C31C55|nr:PREDICTED: cytochrome P450 71A25-like isoform X1 [Fragaria vesca subsp. vesca]